MLKRNAPETYRVDYNIKRVQQSKIYTVCNLCLTINEYSDSDSLVDSNMKPRSKLACAMMLPYKYTQIDSEKSLKLIPGT